MDKSILVIGDLMIDHYLWGTCERISPEAPVQIIDVVKEDTLLGGAGNLINNLVSLDMNVSVLSVIGDDENGKELKNMLLNLSIKNNLVQEAGRQTSKKSRVMASHSHVLRVDKETKKDISHQSEMELVNHLRSAISNYDMILLSDYAKGVLTHTLTQNIIKMANENCIKVLVDPKGSDYTKYKGAYLLTPNKKEIELATKIKIVDDRSLAAALNKLKEITDVIIPLVTLSEDGIAMLDDDTIVKKPTVVKEVFDVTGAGDTVLASLGYSICKKMNIIDALEFANLAAGVVVGKIGSATVTLEEMEEYKSLLHKSSIESHIKTFDEIKRIVERFRKQNKKIVFTNGCFDILHRGHVQYLDTAKSYGDILILGLNSDESVRALKGPSRPITDEDDRAFMLAALESVDYVVKFTQDTPYELIKIVKPDVLVKGGDYEGKEVVGSDIAKEIRLVQFVDGKSTTKTIEKIQCQS